MPTQKIIYSGQLVTVVRDEDYEALGLYEPDNEDQREPEILAEAIKVDMRAYGNYLSVRYWLTHRQTPPDQLLAATLNTLYGNTDAEYQAHYSEITGYLWTDEWLKVGGHDLIERLRPMVGDRLHMEIEYSKTPKGE